MPFVIRDKARITGELVGSTRVPGRRLLIREGIDSGQMENTGKSIPG